MTKVKNSLKEGKWDESDKSSNCAHELTYNSSEDILLKNTRLVIPTAAHVATLLAHVGHQGIEKAKWLLREKIGTPIWTNK